MKDFDEPFDSSYGIHEVDMNALQLLGRGPLKILVVRGYSHVPMGYPQHRDVGSNGVIMTKRAFQVSAPESDALTSHILVQY
ncbi:hypothetical protein HIM_04992 [Hirsutella minnesotensis 3608]|uniref:Uncharacterized protein n=1 Tax=Hirsutella minnesotensis 3608 TaxID=1043627 RepID=A0A0F8A5L3_9HYPO|nr:hypothetical protein HIM_04992 [Hirsutella minnesotensis 3608]